MKILPVALAVIVLASCSSKPSSSTSSSTSSSVPMSRTSVVPPPTRVDPVKETIQGTEIVDNYRWLEGDNSKPNERGIVTTEVAAWTDAQNTYTRAVLDNLPGRKAIED